MSVGTSIEDSSHSESVPTMLPPMRTDTPAPVRPARGLMMLPATVALWFLPKRMGVVLAAAGWRPAVLMHVLAVVLGLGMISYAVIVSSSAVYGVPGVITFRIDMPKFDLSASEALRAPFAALVLLVYGATRLPGGWVNAILVVLGIPIAILSVAILLMPFFAAGERASLLLGRCVRLTLWSTTMVVPLGIGYLVWPSIVEALCGTPDVPSAFTFGFAEPPDDASWPLAVYGTAAAACVFTIWWIVVLVRSGSRFAGPADGPAWKRSRPRCRRCGYIIAGIALDANCPECSKPAAESLAMILRTTRFTRWNAYVACLRALVSAERE